MKYPIRNAKFAFTLIELLVVLAILAILVGLLLPAIQKVREAADRMRCASNLKQLGFAARSYEAQMGHLPPGYVGPIENEGSFSPDDRQNHGVGLLAFLLPYVEQDAIYREMPPNNWDVQIAGPAWWTDRATNGPNWRLAQTSIMLFTCPSDNLYDDSAIYGTVVAYHHFNVPHPGGYAATGCGYDLRPSEAEWLSGIRPIDERNILGRTNYVGVAGLHAKGTHPIWSKYEGLFTNRSQNRLDQVSDGTSHTLMFGELLGGLGAMDSGGDDDRRQSFHTWMGVGSLPTAGGMRPNDHNDWRFGSRHAAVVQFCFADGSVHALRRGNTYMARNPIKLFYELNKLPRDWWVLQELAGMWDGKVTNMAALEY